MANRFDWNALEGKIESTIANNDELNRTKALTALALSEILEVDIDEAIDAITDGPNDRGADAVFIDNRENKNCVHIFQTKCVSEFKKSKTNFPSTEIDKVTSLVDDLTGHDVEVLENVNPLLRAKVADVLDTLKETNSTVTIHFIGNTAPLIESEEKRIRAVFRRYSAIDFRMHDLDTLSDFFLDKAAPTLDREFTIIETDFFDRTDANLRGVVCSIPATQLIEAMRSDTDPNQVETGIFDQNVRVFLSKKNRINRRIIESALSDQNHMFWYQNNGITMTCDKYHMGASKRSPKIKLENVQIVNGGQTSNCLFEAAKEDSSKIDDVILLVRIIETSSEEVKLSIAETTNSQTPINVRDLRSNDRQQRQFEDAFADLNLYYERKAGQHADKPKVSRIDALVAGQAYLAYGEGIPETAKKDRGRVFGDLYETVFSESLTAPMLLTSYRLSQLINAKKAEVRRRIKASNTVARGEMALIDGAFHILFAIRQICNRDGIDIYNLELASEKMGEACEVVFSLYEEKFNEDENFSSNRFFKDTRTKDITTQRVG